MAAFDISPFCLRHLEATMYCVMELAQMGSELSCRSAPGGTFRTIASGQLLGSVQELLVTDVFISLRLPRDDGPCVGQTVGRGAEVHSELTLTLLGEKSW